MIGTRVFVNMGGGTQWYWRTARIGAAFYLQPEATWPEPDPATRVIVHGCDWVECQRTDTTRYGYWGQYLYLCTEHGDLVGDDGSMDEPQ